ncbi:MAG TPA: glycosyltransferase [Pyrinomonadaceae bacterium]|nr:glycosyltransferase [Pyrinomonadaceae bacterium]
MDPKLSVITCAHNPRPDYLDRVIDGLKGQGLNKEHWEYLLVDNASRQPLSGQIDLSWHPQARHVREEKLGLTHARLRGIRESSGEILVFVDDDNVLDADYLAEVIRIAGDWPMLGAFSGQVRASFEETPPEWTRPYWRRLAINEFDRDSWSNVPCLDQTTPNGAGLCVRRRVATEYLAYHASGKRKVVLDRMGESLLSAGDLDLAATACDLGLGNGLFAALKLTHLIPKERLSEPYLLNLLEAQVLSARLLESFRSNGDAEAKKRLKTIIADQLRPLFMSSRERRFFRAVRSGERIAVELLTNNH